MGEDYKEEDNVQQIALAPRGGPDVVEQPCSAIEETSELLNDDKYGVITMPVAVNMEDAGMIIPPPPPPRGLFTQSSRDWFSASE